MHAAQDAVNKAGKPRDCRPSGSASGCPPARSLRRCSARRRRVEYTVVGDAVNLSQRLQQFAEPGQTVLSEATWAALTNPPAGAEQLDASAGEGPGDAGPVLPHRPRRCRCLPARSDIMTMTDTDSEPLDPRRTRSRARPRPTCRPIWPSPCVRSTGRSSRSTAPVRAFRGADLDLRRGSSSRSWDRRAAASRRCSTSSPASTSPTKGRRGGRRVHRRARRERLAIMRRKHIGIVFQFFNLLEGMTVLENVVMPAVDRRA